MFYKYHFKSPITKLYIANSNTMNATEPTTKNLDMLNYGLIALSLISSNC
jgi:hypothetical protein